LDDCILQCLGDCIFDNIVYLWVIGCSCVVGACIGVSAVYCIGGVCVLVSVVYACICVMLVTGVDDSCIYMLVIVLTVVQVAGKVLRRTYPTG